MKKLTFVTIMVCCVMLITSAGSINLLAAGNDSGVTAVSSDKHEHKDGKHKDHDHKDHKHKKDGPKICGKCGEIKGGEKCCKPGAEKCGCGLNHGSPGCCKIKKGKDVALCTHCGEIKGGEKCCKADAKKCPKCNLNAGSPGCCKIKKPKKT
jgi:ABC-type nickel/cobalt efflux system permease component RcnA